MVQDAWNEDTFLPENGAAEEVPYETLELWKNESAAALRHAYDSYLRAAYPADDVRPRSCGGSNSQVRAHPRVLQSSRAEPLRQRAGDQQRPLRRCG